MAFLLQSTGSRHVGFSRHIAEGSAVVGLGLESTGSVVVAHGLCCSRASGLFPDQRLNLCPLHWLVDSSPLYHQRSPPTFLVSFVSLPSEVGSVGVMAVHLYVT